MLKWRPCPYNTVAEVPTFVQKLCLLNQLKSGFGSNTVKSQVLKCVYNMEIKFSFHKQSEKASMCFWTKRASTHDFMVLTLFSSHLFINRSVNLTEMCRKVFFISILKHFSLILDGKKFFLNFGQILEIPTIVRTSGLRIVALNFAPLSTVQK